MKALPTVAAAGLLAVALTCDMALPVETIEAVGAEKCSGAAKTFEVEFLAPDNTSLAGTAKVVVAGLVSKQPNDARLSIDGRECRDGRCPFEAKKGQTYKFVVASELPRIDNLCVVVARP